MANTKITSSVITDNSIGISALNVTDGSSGQVLTTNGSGTLSFANSAGGVDGIVSNANATAITIDSSERVGINCTPTVPFQVQTTNDYQLRFMHHAGTSQSRIQSVNTSAGSYRDIGILGLNTIFYQDGTERTRISSNGRVSIGTTISSEAKLDIRDAVTGTWVTRMENTSAGDGMLLISAGAAAGNTIFNARGNSSTNYMKLNGRGSLCIGSNSSSGCIEPNGLNSGSYQGITWNSPNVSSPRHNYSWSNGLYWWNGSNEGSLSSSGAWTNGSDIAFKKNVADIEYGLLTVLNLQPRKYQMKLDDIDDIGFIAQEIETVIPEIVHTNENSGYKSLDYGAITAVLVKAMQEQQTLIEDLKSRIETLEG